MIHYGFQRLALLNSAGYKRAEMPLDAAVSLIAPNNTGKTSLINALQYLLIIDKRRMDFGAHDAETSRRFYFPDNSAYILLEVALPNSGTVVLGCVGKGVSHDYEYFAYKGSLRLSDYRLPDGSLLQHPQLRSHMAKLGQLVFFYSSSEFAAALYGGRKKLLDQEPDFTVFKLDHVSDADTFQRVLTRTLRLDKLRSSEVKDYLLAIFRRDLPDANIDFKAEWDKAFAEVNADRAQYDAALNQRAVIEVMATQQERRRELRGKILRFRPVLETLLEQWQEHFTSQTQLLSETLRNIDAQQESLQQADRKLVARQSDIKHAMADLERIQKRQDTLANQFALISSRGVLEASLAREQALLDAQTALVQNASSRSIETIQRDIDNGQREQHDIERKRATLSANLYLHLKSELPANQLAALNRLLNPQVMTLATREFSTTPDELRAWLAKATHGNSGTLALPGLRILTGSLAPGHTQHSEEELKRRGQEVRQQLENLTQQMAAARDLEHAQSEKDRLARSVKDSQSQIDLFDEWQSLVQKQTERELQQSEFTQEWDKLDQELAQSHTNAQKLRTAERETQTEQDRLKTNHTRIEHLRENRRDRAPMFDILAELPLQPWIGTVQPDITDLAPALENYHKDCEELIRLDRDLESRLAQLHAGGLTKFHFEAGSESEIERIVTFAACLPQEAEALERKARSAVVNVTASLRELRDGLQTFKSRMRDFNRLISRRQLSDLSVFKIEPVDEREMVEAVEQLISTAEHTQSGETFELFNHGSVLDDAALNRAKRLLIHEGEVRGCLRIEHFFRLEFIVGKAGRKEESFSDMDSAASNGTVLMAKLATGLALLHLMQDKRHKVQAICYLDEASALDQRNQRNLIETAEEFGFALIFASPTPLTTARYCIPITSRDGYNLISSTSWMTLEPLNPESDTVALSPYDGLPATPDERI